MPHKENLTGVFMSSRVRYCDPKQMVPNVLKEFFTFIFKN